MSDRTDTNPFSALGAILLVLALVLLVFVALGMQHASRQSAATPAPTNQAATLADFTPPSPNSIPEGPDGEAIRRGEQLFRETGVYAREYVGSGLNCSNCHLDSGRKPLSSPMWAAWGKYPAWRKKTGAISTMEDRILGCFIYSMNAQASAAGVPPPPGHDIYRDLQAYFAWLATGVQVGAEMPGRGFLKLAEPGQGMDRERGASVYSEKCAMCHGPDGGGQRNEDGSYTYPPLWGERSYNWGAGMSKMANAAGFIKVNMPFGAGNTLTDQQAWDVAAFINSHERPRDPRQTGSIEAARAAHHQAGDYYGQVIDGDLLGDGQP